VASRGSSGTTNLQQQQQQQQIAMPLHQQPMKFLL
jgi:hypothetical protein